MSKKQFPRTNVGGVDISRMLIGTNWISGYSHTSPASDNMIKAAHSEKESIYRILKTFLESGVDAIIGAKTENKPMMDAVKMAEDKVGRKLHMIVTPVLNVDDNKAARKESEDMIKDIKKSGAVFCFPHHVSVEQLVNKNTQTINRLPDYLKMIRDHDMIPGCSAHMPEIITYCDANEYDVESYIQIFNAVGFLMQIEIESVQKIIWNAKKPVMTIKPMAAGRLSPLPGFTFAWNAIRPIDMVAVGCFNEEEVTEDIEYGFASLEHRLPNVAKRGSSGAKGSSVFDCPNG